MKGQELYRDKTNAKLAGVCAGLARYFNMELWLVRILMFSGLILVPNVTLLGYLAGWMILGTKPAATARIVGGEKLSDEVIVEPKVPELKETVWQAGESSSIVIAELDKTFESLKYRIRGIEKCVTSKDFSLHTQFNRL